MSLSNICQYANYYHSPIHKKNIKFECKENSLNSGFCKYHDENYLPGHEDEIKSEIKEKLEQCEQFGLPFECVGYHLPELDLENLEFSVSINFIDVKFHGEIIFDYTKFKKYVVFSDSVFYENASFNNSEFFDNLIFQRNKSQNILFRYSKFKKNSDFRNTKFEDSSFFSCEFSQSDFSECEFINSVSFSSCIFKMETDFIDSVFKDQVNFSSSKFYQEVKFINIIFQNKVSFHNVEFFEPKLVHIDGDLSMASFLNTDLSRVHFENNVVWNNSPQSGKFSKFNQCRFVIFDEILLENNEPNLDLNSVLDVYRNLRENYDYYLRYDDAGEFFIREMELKRKFSQTTSLAGSQTSKKNRVFSRFSITGWYGLLSQYGHSILRPLISSSIIFTFFLIFFLTNNFCDFKPILELNFELLSKCQIGNFDEVFDRTISGFFPFYTLYNGNLVTSDIVLRLLMLPISGMFFISLKRKLERKFRH